MNRAVQLIRRMWSPDRRWLKPVLTAVTSSGAIWLGWAHIVATVAASVSMAIASAVAFAVAWLHARKRACLTAWIRVLVAVHVFTGVLAVLVLVRWFDPVVGAAAALVSAAILFVALAANRASANRELGDWRGTDDTHASAWWTWLIDVADTVLDVPPMPLVIKGLKYTAPVGRVGRQALLGPASAALAAALLLFTVAEGAIPDRLKRWPIGSGVDITTVTTTTPTTTTTTTPSTTSTTRRGHHSGGRLTGEARGNVPDPNRGCGPIERIGAGAPARMAEQLRALVAGDPSLRWDGFGTDVTGCMGDAFEERDQPGVFLTEGYCGGELRSLGVVSGTRRAHLLL